jgi:RimJ/RimL family protein N-acetyltransferase
MAGFTTETTGDAVQHGTGPWRCMPRPRLSGGGLTVSAVEPAHIEDIRCWRNAQLEVLRQAHPIAPAEQQAYFSTHIWPEKEREEPRNVLLVIAEAPEVGDATPSGRVIGYGGLVHIAWPYQRAEVSFLLEPSLARQPQVQLDVFVRFMRLMQTLAFVDLGLVRLTSETYAFRTGHIAALERCGFVREGVLRDHVVVDGARCDAVLHGCLARDHARSAP